MIHGRCECGQVRFRVPAVRDSVTVCHCSQCRRMSGHLWASTHAADFDAVTFLEDAGLTWFASSDRASRGFCRNCGANLFWRATGEQGVGIAAGCLEPPTGLRLGKHIHTVDKGDYYAITDDLPQD